MMKKLLSLMLALLMLLCGVSAFADAAGGWAVPEDTMIPDEAFEAFYGAVGEDADLWPQCLMGTQVVAGINYAVLCAGLDDVEIVYVYHSVSGENQLLRRQVLAGNDDLTGGWRMLEDGEPGEDVIDAIGAAFGQLTGIGVDEFYIISKQVVAGTNYAVLLHKTTVTAEPVMGWALAAVYVDLEGTASITEITDLALSAAEE